jgi:serine/threonine protein kinase
MIEKIGKYEVVEKIGVGGFGTVYKGRDPFIKRTVAIKTCQSDDEEIKKRFFREAELSGNLHHRNITTIYDFGVEAGIPFIVQEYLTGEDLDKKIKRGEFTPVTRKIEILMDIAEGLSYAHESGIIHRDMKPSNVRILEDGSVKIMDFGIAKSFQSESNLTQTGITLGTAAYLAPEQIRGENVDPRTDIFSLGVLSYELFAGQKPFRGEHISTVLFKILNEKPDPVSRAGLQLPPALERAIYRAMDKDPSNRYGRIEEFRRDLASVLKELKGADTTEAARQPARDSTTVPSLPKPVPPIPSATVGINVTPPSGMLARASSRRPAAETTPTPGAGLRPRAMSLELVDFRNPTGSEQAAPSPPAPVFHVSQEKSRLPLFLGLVILLGAAIGVYYYYQNLPAPPQPRTRQSPPASPSPAVTSSAPPPAPTAPGPSTGAATSAQASPPEQSAASSEPAAPEAAKPEPPAPPKKFSVTFTTSPAATLFVDGREIGQTVPKKTLSLVEGAHTYRVEMEDGETFEQKIRVGRGERASYMHRWPIGSLFVSAGPAWNGAHVMVDGKTRGRIPLHGYLLVSPGAHEIAVSKDGLPPFLKTMRIEEGRRQELPIPSPEKM